MIPFTLSALNAAHASSSLTIPPTAPQPLEPPPSATQEAAAPIATPSKPEPARDPTARLAAALAESEKAARKKKV
eukprot:COSAG02_NODE_2963_length_7646_cov_10.941036_4_plen_75_part_00